MHAAQGQVAMRVQAHGNHYRSLADRKYLSGRFGSRRCTTVVRSSLESLNQHFRQQQKYSFKLYGNHIRQERMDTVRLYFQEVLNNSCLELLDAMVVDNVVYNEKNVYNEDFIGRKRLRRIVAEYQQAYPTMRYSVMSTTADDYGETIIACWKASGVSLGTRMNMPASGRSSQLSGMSMFKFNSDGKITDVILYRTPLAEEAPAFEDDWSSSM